MPSRQPDPQPPPVEVRHHRHHVPPFLLPLAAASAALTLLLLIAIIFRKLAQRRIALADLNQPRHFSYSALRRATCSFSPSRKLGQGGFGSVYRAELPGSSLPLAVKVMDSGSLQGDREFHNELSLAPQINGCDRIVSLLGFSSHRRGSRLLVYELMPNGSLQDALLDRRCSELMTWSRRFSVAIDVARGLLFLHVACDPPIIHGDIKPSNILLDAIFSAKIADFGLARAKTHDLTVQIPSPDPIVHQQHHHHHQQDGTDEGSATESMTTITTTTIFEDGGNGNAILVERSPDEASNSEILEKAVSASEANFNFNNDKVSSESGRRKSRWRKQDNGGASDSGSVKDYVMEWIGSEVKKERPKSNWIASDEIGQPTAKRKKKQRRPEWWPSLDVERIRKKSKSRPAREWWREEFCDELSKKKKKNKKRIAEAVGGSDVGDQWWQREMDEVELQDKKKKTRSRSRSSVDWWMDGLSGEFRLGRRRSLDGIMGGDISKSGGISSTPSMRGTVCYVAPEYGGGGAISEMCDVYSYGVLLLVIVSGRRPLQVTASPMSEFERANLISWTRHLARRGKLLDLVDPGIQGLDREQALLCITIALLCLQRSPSQRPTMKEIVGMLSGECEPPHLPLEFSPSPPSGFPFKSGKKPGKSR